MWNWFNILEYDYKHKKIINIIFTYKILGDTNKKITKEVEYNKKLINKLPIMPFNGYDLPRTLDINLWGQLLDTKNYKYYLIKRPNSDLYYEFFLETGKRRINILYMYGPINYKILTFNDYYIYNNEENNTKFIRFINKEEIHYNDNKYLIMN